MRILQEQGFIDGRTIVEANRGKGVFDFLVPIASITQHVRSQFSLSITNQLFYLADPLI